MKGCLLFLAWGIQTFHWLFQNFIWFNNKLSYTPLMTFGNVCKWSTTVKWQHRLVIHPHGMLKHMPHVFKKVCVLFFGFLVKLWQQCCVGWDGSNYFALLRVQPCCYCAADPQLALLHLFPPPRTFFCYFSSTPPQALFLPASLYQ